MSGSLVLDWALLALSLFNTILLLWLGLTVLLTAERRVWALWLAGGGLLAGALVFISHSAVLVLGPAVPGRNLDFWWRSAWAPILFLPCGWHLLMLWYAGFWGSQVRPAKGSLRTRQRLWLVAEVFILASLVGLTLFGRGLPALADLIQAGSGVIWPGTTAPWFLLIYPVYVVLCIGLSVDAVLRPDPTARWMGDLARGRARPWFVAAALALLAVSLLVAGGMLWLARLRHASLPLVLLAGWLDLLVTGLIGLAVVSLGQAIVTYEVFTGKPLPRHGFRRYWRNALILAAGYGATVSGSQILRVQPFYSLLLSTLLLVVFYALLSWRSIAERERAMQRLRPFVAGRRFTDQLMPGDDEPPGNLDARGPFETLCSEVLGAELAYLVPLGPLAPLAGPPLAYPAGCGAPAQVPWLSGDVAQRIESPAIMCLPLRHEEVGGAEWAVPLWSERGLIGVLLLGPRRDGSLYSQEEIEVGRATGERLLDNLAGAEMARRLVALQRQRLAESQILDGRARRRLHDDVLPRLHTALLTLSSRPDAVESEPAEALAMLATVHRQLSDLLHEMPAPVEPLLTRLGLVAALHEVAARELAGAFDEVTWQVAPEAEGLVQMLPPLVAEVVFCAAREVIRNAARYGRGPTTTEPLRLQVHFAGAQELNILIEDNGVGFSAQERAPGRAPTAQAAAGDVPEASRQAGGQGLALHATMMTVIGGSLEVASRPNAYTRVRLSVPAGKHES